MFRLTETVPIERPTAEVWAVLVDFPGVPAWERDVLEVRQTSPGRPGVGTTLAARRSYAGRAVDVECRIVDWQDGRSVTMEIIGGPTRRTFVRYAVDPVGAEACQVTFSVEGEMRRFLSWLAPFIPAAGRRLVRTNLGALKRLVEATS
jgi:polyketide cyclase/dehydrase/lipid transport protein